MTVSRVMLFGLSLVFVTIFGCGGDGGPANRLPTKPVKVTLSYKGAPVPDATITFIPQGDSPPAFGKTDAQGVAKMKTYVEGDGATLGQHKVTINKSETQSTGPVADQASADYAPPAGGGTPPPVVKFLVPQKYSLPGSSGLVAEVKDSGSNDITFDLKD